MQLRALSWPGVSSSSLDELRLHHNVIPQCNAIFLSFFFLSVESFYLEIDVNYVDAWVARYVIAAISWSQTKDFIFAPFVRIPNMVTTSLSFEALGISCKSFR